jgi:hypothetical protein
MPVLRLASGNSACPEHGSLFVADLWRTDALDA